MKRTALLVLGMHHSGSQALARVLHSLGAGLPQDAGPRGGGPPDAPGESASLARLNDSILHACEADALDAHSPPSDALEAHSKGMLGKQAAAFLQCQCGDAPTYVLAEARLARLMPFWLPVLRDAGHEPRFVVMVREPQAVAAAAFAQHDAHDPERTRLLWLGHLLDAERDTRGHRRVFLTYDAWTTNAQACLEKMAQAWQLRWKDPDAAIAAQGAPHALGATDDEHAAAAPMHLIERWVTDAYHLLLRGDVHVLPAFFDALRPDFDGVAALPRLAERRCRAAFNIEAQKLFKAQRDALAELQRERDEALATLAERHALILKLHAMQQHEDAAGADARGDAAAERHRGI